MPDSLTPNILPRPDFHFPGEVGRTFEDSDPAQFPQPIEAPKDAPNILLVLIDDVGFGQFSTFGGGVPSPTMDRLAAEGLRFNRFHTTALCSPTRAALILAGTTIRRRLRVSPNSRPGTTATLASCRAAAARSARFFVKTAT